MPFFNGVEIPGLQPNVNYEIAVIEHSYDHRSENAQSGKAVADALKTIDFSNCASVIKNTKSGSIVTMNDVSPVEHSLDIKLDSTIEVFDYARLTSTDTFYVGESVIMLTNSGEGFTNETLSELCPELKEGDIVTIKWQSPDDDRYVALFGASFVSSSNDENYYCRKYVVTEASLNNQVEISGLMGGIYNLSITINEINVKVSRYGKNLFDKSKVTIGKRVKNTDGTLSTPSAGDKYCATDFIPVIPNATYICSGFSSHDDLTRQFAFYDKNKIFVSGGSNSNFVNVIPENAFYMRRNFFTADIDKIQIEVGSVVTEYEPYKEPQTVTSNEDGIVTGLKSISPNMTLLTDTNGVIINTTYNVDTKTYIDNSSTNGELIVIDQTYNPESENSQSGKAVAEAVEIAHSKLVTGKNLLDINKITSKTRFNDDGSTVSDTTACITDFIPVKYGHSYCFSKTVDGVLDNLLARRIIGYDKDKNFVTALATANTTNIWVANENVAFMRCQMNEEHAKSNGQIEIGLQKSKYEEYYQEYVPIVSKDTSLSKNNVVVDFTVQASNDFTIIGDQILTSVIASDTNTRLTFYGFDVENGKSWINGYINTDFGHVNTIDYNVGNGCLIFGNGANDYNTDGKFYVIPNAKSLFGKTSATLEDDTIEFDCTSLNLGSKLQACWAYDNDGANDMVCVITDDNAKIYIVQLGKGTHDLGNGVLKPCAENEFNGTFKLQQTYTLEDGRTDVTNPYNVNQGSSWYGSNLYLAVGKSTGYWRVFFTTSNTETSVNGIAQYEENIVYSCSPSGDIKSNTTQGIHVTQDYIVLLSIVETGSANRRLRFYKR